MIQEMMLIENSIFCKFKLSNSLQCILNTHTQDQLNKENLTQETID